MANKNSSFLYKSFLLINKIVDGFIDGFLTGIEKSTVVMDKTFRFFKSKILGNAQSTNEKVYASDINNIQHKKSLEKAGDSSKNNDINLGNRTATKSIINTSTASSSSITTNKNKNTFKQK